MGEHSEELVGASEPEVNVLLWKHNHLPLLYSQVAIPSLLILEANNLLNGGLG